MYWTYANEPSHAESSWLSNELTEVVVTTEVESQFQNYTTRIGKDDFLQRH